MTTLDPRNDAFIMRIESAHAPVAVLVFNDQALFNSVEHNVLLLIGELGKGFGEGNLVLLSHRFEHAVEVLSMRRTPRRNCTLCNGQIGIRDHQVGIYFKLGTQAVAVFTRAIGRVEREVSRCRFVEAIATLWTRKMLTKGEYFAFVTFHAHQFNFSNAFCKTQCSFQTVGETSRNVVFLYQAVDDDFNRVLLVAR